MRQCEDEIRVSYSPSKNYNKDRNLVSRITENFRIDNSKGSHDLRRFKTQLLNPSRDAIVNLKKKTLLFQLGSKKLFREINFSSFQEEKNNFPRFGKLQFVESWKDLELYCLLFFWSPVPTIAFPFRWCTKPSFNKFTCYIFEHSAIAKPSQKFHF